MSDTPRLAARKLIRMSPAQIAFAAMTPEERRRQALVEASWSHRSMAGLYAVFAADADGEWRRRFMAEAKSYAALADDCAARSAKPSPPPVGDRANSEPRQSVSLIQETSS